MLMLTRQATPRRQYYMTQAQFEKALAEKLEISKVDTIALLEDIRETLEEGCRADGFAVIRGLGRFKINAVPAKPARMGRNPATGEQMKLKAKPKSQKLRILPDKGLRDWAVKVKVKAA